MRLTRLKKCDAWLICLRRDGELFDGYKAEISLQWEPMLIGRSTANIIWDEGRLKCQVRNENGDWYDLRNSDVEANLRRYYHRLLLLSVAGDRLAMLNLGDWPMENSEFNHL
jgi:hypothetical protein